MADGEQTTLRKFDRELGEHDARLEHLEKTVEKGFDRMDEQHTIMLAAITGLTEDRARSQGRQQIISAGSGLAAGGVMAWILKQAGIG